MKSTEKRISSGLLQMKFMTKTRKKMEEQEDKQKNDELKRQFIQEPKMEAPDEPSTAPKRQLEFCNDIQVLENLAFGRMSFKGCNPEVEKLMVYYERKRRGDASDEEEEEEEETDVTDAQMAKTLSGGGASASIANKFRGKGPRSREGNAESGGNRLNFDSSNIRKRKSGPEDFSRPPKFMKPAD